MERFRGTVGEEVSNRVNGMLVGTGKSVLGASLWGLASTLAMGFAKRAVLRRPSCGGSREPPGRPAAPARLHHQWNRPSSR